LGLGDGEGLTDLVGLGLEDGLVLGDGVALGLVLGDGVALGLVLGDGVALGLVLGEGVALGLVLGEGVLSGPELAGALLLGDGLTRNASVDTGMAAQLEAAAATRMPRLLAGSVLTMMTAQTMQMPARQPRAASKTSLVLISTTAPARSGAPVKEGCSRPCWSWRACS
jgi:hypothetical protein